MIARPQGELSQVPFPKVVTEILGAAREKDVRMGGETSRNGGFYVVQANRA